MFTLNQFFHFEALNKNLPCSYYDRREYHFDTKSYWPFCWCVFAFSLGTAILKICWRREETWLSSLYTTLLFKIKKKNRTQAKSSLTSALALKHGSTSCESHFELWMLFFYFCFNVHGSLYTCNMYEHIFKDAVFDWHPDDVVPSCKRQQ